MSVFDTKQRTYRHRNELRIQLRLAGAEKAFPATVFASLGERASDLLNDDRAFIPVRLADGETMIVAKSQIASITETRDDASSSKFHGEDFSKGKKPADAHGSKALDAYAILRVEPSASLEEIRAAYKARMKTVHPDALSALGLDEDIAKAAVNAAQRVNLAYQRILRDRGAEPQPERAV